MLAGLAKGPNYFSPERHPDRARERLAYVLGRMQEDGAITADAGRGARPACRAWSPPKRARRDSGLEFLRPGRREVRQPPGFPNLATAAYTVRSTIRPDLQRAAETALQEGLAQYEMRDRPGRLPGPGSEPVRRDQQDRRARGGPKPGKPAGSRRSPPRVCRCTTCTGRRRSCLGPGKKRRASGRPRRRPRAAACAAAAPRSRKLNLYDVVFVKVTDAKGRGGGARRPARAAGRAGRRAGAGEQDRRILAMAGGFSYPAEPAQSHHAGAAAAGLGDQAVHLSGGAARRACSPTRSCATSRITLPPIGQRL